MAVKRVADSAIRLRGASVPASVHFSAARIEEGLSLLTETRLEFVTGEGDLDPGKLLGTRMTIELPNAKGGPRRFHGFCIAIENIGLSRGHEHFAADLRPWPWFLTRRSDNRIFQDMSTPDIVAKVCDAAGFNDIRDRLSGTYAPREYCVQYGESDFAFISRLMEEEGITFYFDHSGDLETMVLADAISGHDPVAGASRLPYIPRMRNTPVESERVFELADRRRVVSGQVSLIDYDMVNPQAHLGVGSAIEKGSHSHRKYELYDSDARYATAGAGEQAAKIRMEAEAHRAERFVAVANAPGLAAGSSVTITDHPRLGRQAELLILRATHHLRVEETLAVLPEDGMTIAPRLEFPGPDGLFHATVELARLSEPFRPPRVTPWPDLSGLHTAVVTGPSGEEIHTDEYGRIKVQFHWDRKGEKNEKTTCWVRSVLPWTGKSWGMFAVPRVGQEVVIQFERGNPDRPLCTGMIYNGANKPPVTLPEAMTQSGIRTNSSKGGGGYNELVFEDKKNAEFVRLQSEKDFVQIVKNNATVMIGLEKKDKGDLTQTIHGHKTETIKTGNHVLKIETGSQTVEVKKDHSAKVEGKSKTTVKGDAALEVETGNCTTKVTAGNYTLDASAGKVTITAAQEITLKVGASSVKIGPAGVEIKSVMVKLEGSAMAEMKSPLTTVKADGMLTLKGGVTMIN